MAEVEHIPNILKPQDVYIFEYPEAIAFADKQNSVFWTHSEIDVSKDVQDILVNLTPSEKHGVLTVLKLFTLYELIIGNEYWGTVVKKAFKRPEIERMANSFSFFEINVHAPFYNKINEALHINTEEFYRAYEHDEILNDRIKFIWKTIMHGTLEESLAVFSMLEGAILYSSFAYLKHFQSQGKNKLVNVVAGINFSVRDELIHHEGGSWLFRTLVKESKYTPEQLQDLYNRIYDLAHVLREHEHRINSLIFSKGKIDGITQHQSNNFADSRIDLCLQNLGLSALYNPSSNPIAEWFYRGIEGYVMHDFFSKQGREYKRNWIEDNFVW